MNLSFPSTFFIVIVASLPHVWSDYPMALMIERQDWGLGVINDFQSCHHLPNLCAGSPGLQSHVPGSQAVPVSVGGDYRGQEFSTVAVWDEPVRHARLVAIRESRNPEERMTPANALAR